MRKVIITISIVGALLIIADSVDVGHWLLLFILAGILPGTDISIAPIDVLAAIATALTIVIMRVTLWSRIRLFFFEAHITTAAPRIKRTRRRTA